MGRYDAVIVQAHQIMDTDAIRRLEERIIETGVPAMSIGATMKGCISIGTDDYSAAREMTILLIPTGQASSSSISMTPFT